MNAAPPSAQARFQVLKSLGSGSQGHVELVFDRAREQVVALKRVQTHDPGSMLRLKREFRSVEQVLHPGLVRLYELGQDARGLFFTMEAVDGVTLARYCAPLCEADNAREASTVAVTKRRPRAAEELEGAARDTGEPPLSTTAFRVDRVRRVLPQILDALAALHAHGLIHRDLKPSNVMVDQEDQAKLLDFGILAELGTSGERAGTAAYMAPEQVSGGSLSPATDLYALGAMLFRLLAGRPVFVGPAHRVMLQHLHVPPDALDAACPEAPPALAAWCARLLAKDPAARPTVAELAAGLLPALTAAPLKPAVIAAPPADARGPLVGRGEELAALDEMLSEALDGRFVGCVLRGGTGVGKTALAVRVAERAAQRGMLVLRGRGRPTDRVPFNVLDGAVDALATALARDVDALDLCVGEEIGLAARTFPVLLESGVVSSASPRVLQRAELFAALTTTFARVAVQRGGLLLVLDDLHWADEDSLAFLKDLVDRAPERVVFLGIERDDAALGPAGAAGPPATRSAQLVAASAAAVPTREPRLRQIAIRPLGEREVTEIAARAARACGACVSDLELASLAERAAGRPFLAEIMGWALASTGASADPESAITALLDSAGEDGRGALAALLVGDEAATVERLAGVLERPIGAVDDCLRSLERSGLVRRFPADANRTEAVDLYHDALRAPLAARLDAPAVCRAHERWLATLGESAPPERLVRHLLGAGRTQDAAARALAAAPLLEARLAFGLAADLYAIALDHGAGERRDTLRALARALERGFRFDEAARRFAELAAISHGDARVDALLREASALLNCNRVAAGHARLLAALREAGEPPLTRGGPLAALWTIASLLRGPRRPRRSRAALSPSALERAARDVQLGALLNYFDPFAGLRFLVRAYDGFERVGAVEQLAWCEYLFAFDMLYQDGTRHRVRLSERYVASARARLADCAKPGPAIASFDPLVVGYAAMRQGHFARAEAGLERSVQMLEAGGLAGSFGYYYSLCVRWQIDLARQNTAGLERTVLRMKEVSRESGESAIHCQMTICDATLRALRGDHDEANALMESLERSWPEHPATRHRYLIEIVAVGLAILRDDPRALRRRLARALVGQRPFRLLRGADRGYFASIAAIAELRALRAGDPDASIGAIERWARVVRVAPPLGTTRAIRALAYAEESRGRPERAIALLHEAEREAGRFGQSVDVLIARAQRGKRLGGDEGRRLMEEGRAGLRCAGITEHALDEDAV